MIGVGTGSTTEYKGTRLSPRGKVAEFVKMLVNVPDASRVSNGGKKIKPTVE